ncbi:GntR family transcriptional regulator [Pseudonocardia sp. NPDC049154]|uniref:GntR family transcriptional regulator n=1 Tax=Pseudonocardia sp. NPDC049154 TaxID=3155501 RepID=UPI0033E4A714
MTSLEASGPARGHRPQQLSRHVANHVRERIMSGQLRPGDRLRLEHIAADLGISVTPVREALAGLAGEGFVEAQPRRGFVVSTLDRGDIADVFQIQAYIAADLCARAARTISEQSLAELTQIQTDLETAHDHEDFEEEGRLNFRFHSLINSLSDSPKMLWFLRTAVRYAPLSSYGEVDGWPECSVSDHRLILEALEAHDEDGAHKYMREHVVRSGQLLVEHLERLGLWSR